MLVAVAFADAIAVSFAVTAAVVVAEF